MTQPTTFFNKPHSACFSNNDFSLLIYLDWFVKGCKVKYTFTTIACNLAILLANLPLSIDNATLVNVSRNCSSQSETPTLENKPSDIKKL